MKKVLTFCAGIAIWALAAFALIKITEPQVDRVRAWAWPKVTGLPKQEMPMGPIVIPAADAPADAAPPRPATAPKKVTPKTKATGKPAVRVIRKAPVNAPVGFVSSPLTAGANGGN